MATIGDVRRAARRTGAIVEVRATHGGMREIEVLAPKGRAWRATGAGIIVGHHGRDFASVCADVIERITEGLEP